MSNVYEVTAPIPDVPEAAVGDYLVLHPDRYVIDVVKRTDYRRALRVILEGRKVICLSAEPTTDAIEARRPTGETRVLPFPHRTARR